MPLQITSPAVSFVQFGTLPVIPFVEEQEFALPEYATFKAAFQFAIGYDDGSAVPPDTVFYTAICGTNCSFLQRVRTCVPLCYQTRLLFPGDSTNLQSIAYGTMVQIYNRIVTREEFIQIMNDDFGVTLIDKIDYLLMQECCVTEISIKYKNDAGTLLEIGVGVFYDRLYSTGEVNMGSIVAVDECYRYCITDANNAVIACSNVFKRQSGDKFISIIRYRNNEDAFGFQYPASIYNVITLPIYLSKPQYPRTKNVYRKSTKEIVTLSAVIEKEFQYITELMPDWMHQAFVMAMDHDVFDVWYNSNYKGFSSEAEYKITWVDKKEIDLGQGVGKFKQQLYAYTNSSCGSTGGCCLPPAIEITEQTTTEVKFKLYPTLSAIVFEIQVRQIGATSWGVPIQVTSNDYQPFIFTLDISSYTGGVEFQWRSVCDGKAGEWGILHQIAIGGGGGTPVCVPASIAGYSLQDGTVGVPYHVEIPVAGSSPMAVDVGSPQRIPVWMTATIDGSNNLVFDGIPTETGTNLQIDVFVINCGLTIGARVRTTISITAQPVLLGTVEVNITNGGGGNVIIRNIQTNDQYTITAVDAYGTLQVPYGDYVVEDFHSYACLSPVYPSLNPPLGTQFTIDGSANFSFSIECA